MGNSPDIHNYKPSSLSDETESRKDLTGVLPESLSALVIMLQFLETKII